jgi:endonuclease III
MKNSKKYSEQVDKLHRKLKRKYKKPPEVSYEDPVEALVYAIISEERTISESKKIMKKIQKEFVDFNDLRVALREEIVEILDGDIQQARNTALFLSKSLGSVFKENNMTSLIDLVDMGKRDARGMLDDIDSVSDFVVEYVFLTGLDGHAIPITDAMVRYLRHKELVHPDADRKDIEGFLSRVISADDAYEFYYFLRTESEKNPAPEQKQEKSTKADKTKKSGKKTKKSRSKKSKKKKISKKRKTRKKTKKKTKKKSKKKG